MTVKTYIIQIHCPDQKGLIAGTTQLLAAAGANIIDLTQHTAKDISSFFLRAVFEMDSDNIGSLRDQITLYAEKFQLTWKLHDTTHVARLAIFVSKTDHCLYDLLLKQRDGYLNCEFSCIIGNHTDLEAVSLAFGIPFYHVDSKQDKALQNERFNEIISETKTEMLLLARYMQILSPDFVNAYKNQIINIHHGFLPAFKGAKPYHQAWYRGVKIIGATAHFATEDLDQGPIICQNIQHIPETADIEQLVQLGKDIEKKTLSQAVKLWLERRIFVEQNRTFIL